MKPRCYDSFTWYDTILTYTYLQWLICIISGQSTYLIHLTSALTKGFCIETWSNSPIGIQSPCDWNWLWTEYDSFTCNFVSCTIGNTWLSQWNSTWICINLNQKKRIFFRFWTCWAFHILWHVVYLFCLLNPVLYSARNKPGKSW